MVVVVIHKNVALSASSVKGAEEDAGDKMRDNAAHTIVCAVSFLVSVVVVCWRAQVRAR